MELISLGYAVNTHFKFFKGIKYFPHNSLSASIIPYKT